MPTLQHPASELDSGYGVNFYLQLSARGTVEVRNRHGWHHPRPLPGRRRRHCVLHGGAHLL